MSSSAPQKQKSLFELNTVTQFHRRRTRHWSYLPHPDGHDYKNKPEPRICREPLTQTAMITKINPNLVFVVIPSLHLP